MDIDCDVAVVGGGFAGLAAALVLVRARRRVVVADAGAPRNRFAAHMHGVLGHNGRSPLALLNDGRQEVASYGGVIRQASATHAVRGDGAFHVGLDDGATLHARRLILATGLRDELPPIAGLAEQWGRGVVSCPYCDGWERRDARLGVLATSAFGVHQAQLVRQWSPRVTFLAHGSDVSADDARALASRAIGIVAERVVRIPESSDGAFVGVELEDGRSLDLDALFVAPRLVLDDRLLRELGVEMDETPFGVFPRTDAMGATSVAGVWAVGNVANGIANVPIAMGSGSSAGAAANMDLVQAEVAAAVAAATASAAAEKTS